jgi:hypothetical protein
MNEQIQSGGCVICGRELPPTRRRISQHALGDSAIPFNGHGRPRVYCSNVCRQRAKRARAGNGQGPARKRREPLTPTLMMKLPLIQPPDSRPAPYKQWTLVEKQEYGPGNRKVQWELQRRVSYGMSLAKAVEAIGLPLRAVQRYIEKNPAFKQRINKAREWAVAKRAEFQALAT